MEKLQNFSKVHIDGVTLMSITNLSFGSQIFESFMGFLIFVSQSFDSNQFHEKSCKRANFFSIIVCFGHDVKNGNCSFPFDFFSRIEETKLP